MPEKVISSMEKMEEALKRLSHEDAEVVMADAAARAEAVADYVERIGRAAERPGA